MQIISDLVLFFQRRLPICLGAFFLIFLLSFFIPNVALAHPGRTSSDGCHYCWTNCDYWGVPYGERHRHNPIRMCYIDTPESEPTTPTPLPTPIPPTSTPRPTYTPTPVPIFTEENMQKSGVALGILLIGGGAMGLIYFLKIRG